MNIPEDAVEAALNKYSIYLNGYPASELSTDQKPLCKQEALNILKAAAPYIYAQALRDILADLSIWDEDPGIEEIESLIRARADRLKRR